MERVLDLLKPEIEKTVTVLDVLKPETEKTVTVLDLLKEHSDNNKAACKFGASAASPCASFARSRNLLASSRRVAANSSMVSIDYAFARAAFPASKFFFPK